MVFNITKDKGLFLDICIVFTFQAKDLHLSLILLCVICVFFVTNFPRLFLNLYEMFYCDAIIACGDRFFPPVWFICSTAVNHLLLVVNCIMNFVVYCYFNRSFRYIFWWSLYILAIYKTILKLCLLSYIILHSQNYLFRGTIWDLGIKWGLCKPRPITDANANNEIQSDIRNGATVCMDNTINLIPSACDNERLAERRSDNSNSINQTPTHAKPQRFAGISKLSHRVSQTSFKSNAKETESENIQMNSISFYTISDKNVFASNINSSGDSMMH